MATAFSRQSAQQPFPSSRSREERPAKRKKEQRTEIWSNLLRQTREAQARNRNNALTHRSLVVCDGSPDEQRQFVTSLARPPLAAPPSRNREQRPEKKRGEVTLSNRFAYGYGHVTLFSPPQAGASAFGQESEEVARVEVHTVPEPDAGYAAVLTRLLTPKRGQEEQEDEVMEREDGRVVVEEEQEQEEQRPAIVVLMNWKEPWTFLSRLRAWLQLLADALSPPDARENVVADVLKQAKLNVTVVLQNVEAQMELEREGWKEELFDWLSQCLRTCLLPLHPNSSLIYTSSSAPPQQPGSPLSETQKVVFTSLGLDLAALSPRLSGSGGAQKKEELHPKHNVVDRMAICVPAGWDSVGKIRLLSENFSPEEVLAAWRHDLGHHVHQRPADIQFQVQATEIEGEKQANGGAERPYQTEEVFATTSDVGDDSLLDTNLSTQTTPSAIRSYEEQIVDPNAHKKPKPPTIEVTTRPEQDFLAEMRRELQALEHKDRDRESEKSARSLQASTRSIGMPSGESTGALNELGDVSFNVGGVSYNTVSAEAAIDRLKHPTKQMSESPAPSATTTPRTGTPRPPRAHREEREGSETPVAPAPGSGKEFPSEDLEKYFASLAKKAGGGGESRQVTPSRQP